MTEAEPSTELTCGICGKSKREVCWLLQSQLTSVCVCDECIEVLGSQLIREIRKERRKSAPVPPADGEEVTT